jgi:hypothetical protein
MTTIDPKIFIGNLSSRMGQLTVQNVELQTMLQMVTEENARLKEQAEKGSKGSNGREHKEGVPHPRRGQTRAPRQP